MSTLRNSWPSDEAPKLMTGSSIPVLPRGRVCMLRLLQRRSRFRWGRPKPPNVAIKGFDCLPRRGFGIGERQRFRRQVALIFDDAKSCDYFCEINVSSSCGEPVAIYKMHMPNDGP